MVRYIYIYINSIFFINYYTFAIGFTSDFTCADTKTLMLEHLVQFIVNEVYTKDVNNTTAIIDNSPVASLHDDTYEPYEPSGLSENHSNKTDSIHASENHNNNKTDSTHSKCKQEIQELKERIRLLKREITKLKKEKAERATIPENESCIFSSGSNENETEEVYRDHLAKNENKQNIVSENLKDLIEYADEYTTIKSGKTTLSIETGRKLHMLHSVCNCSKNKLPLILGTVLSIFFGLIDGEIFDTIIRTASCYETAIDRAASVFEHIGDQTFSPYSASPNRIKCANLIMDASTKQGHQVVVKLVSTLDIEDTVQLKALMTDITDTKKATQGSIRTIASLEDELQQSGTALLTSGTADYYGIAELRQVLLHIDQTRQEFSDAIKSQLSIHSTQISDQKYDICAGNFASIRIRNCSMHSIECILKPILDQLIKSSGIQNDATTAQGMYRISYYWKKLRDKMTTLTLLACENDINKLNTLPPSIVKTYKQVCQTRWLSVERQACELVNIMQIPAHKELIKLVSNYYDYHDAEYNNEWENISKLCVCMSNTEQLSHLSLCFLYLCNHGAGGTKGESYGNLQEILGFLCSPLHRISLYISHEIMSLHLKCARFFDSISCIHDNSKCISTKMIEVTVFERNLLTSLTTLKHNWRNALPKSAAYVEVEVQRASNLLKNYDESKMRTCIDIKMEKGKFN